MRVVILGLLSLLTVASAASPPSPKTRRSAIAAHAHDLTAQMREQGQPAAEIHLALAALYARTANDAVVFKHLDRARKLGVAPGRIDLVLALTYRRKGNYDAAIAALLRVLGRSAAQPHALIQLWKTLYEAKLRGIELRSDLRVIHRRLSDHGMHFPATFALDAESNTISARLTDEGYRKLLAKDHRHAAHLFEGAIDASPSNARAHRGLGISRARAHDILRAVGAYLLYLELQPDAPDGEKIDRLLTHYWKQKYRKD